VDTPILGQLTEEQSPFILSAVTKKTPASAEKEAFHRRVLYARLISGKTLQEVEQHFGYGPTTHGKHEDGTNEMKRADLVEFCRFMNIDIRWLMEGAAYIKIGATVDEIRERIAEEAAKGGKGKGKSKKAAKPQD
jgi:hypothetical protein